MERLEEVCEALGFPREDSGRARKRRPVPHVTLARLNGVNTGTGTITTTTANTTANTYTNTNTDSNANTNTSGNTNTNTSANDNANPRTETGPSSGTGTGMGSGITTGRGMGHQHSPSEWITRTQHARGWYGPINGGEIVLFESRWGEGERYVPLGRVLLDGHGHGHGQRDGRGPNERLRNERRLDERRLDEQSHDQRVTLRGEEIVYTGSSRDAEHATDETERTSAERSYHLPPQIPTSSSTGTT
jgi:hypothetical protein